MEELSNSNLMAMLQFASPDSLIRSMLLQLDKGLQTTIEMSILSCDGVDDVNRRRLEEENAQQTSSFNRIVMHSIGNYRDAILKSTDSEIVETQLAKFIDLAQLLVTTAKRHLENAEVLPVELFEVIASSFVGSLLPIVLFSLHSLLREAKEKKLTFSKAALSAVRIFSDFGKSFVNVYGTLKRIQSTASSVLSREPSAAESSAQTMLLGRSVSADLSSCATPKFDVIRSSKSITFDETSTDMFISAEQFDMDTFDEDLGVSNDRGPIALALGDFVYSVEDGAEKSGNYFELSVVESEDMHIVFGLSDCSVSSNVTITSETPCIPGGTDSSYGFSMESGQAFHNQLEIGPSSSTYHVGDIAGCGFNMRNKTVFFTRNGSLLSESLIENITTKSLTPAIAMVTEGSKHKLSINFGQKPFQYSGPEVVLPSAAASLV